MVAKHAIHITSDAGVRLKRPKKEMHIALAGTDAGPRSKVGEMKETALNAKLVSPDVVSESEMSTLTFHLPPDTEKLRLGPGSPHWHCIRC